MGHYSQFPVSIILERSTAELRLTDNNGPLSIVETHPLLKCPFRESVTSEKK